VAPLFAGRRFDADLLAAYCQVWVRWQKAEAGIAQSGQLVKGARGTVQPSPLIEIAHKAATQVRSLERRLGITTDVSDASAERAKPAPRSSRTSHRRLLTRRQLASALGVHMQTITKWEQEGMPVAQRGSRGRASHYDELEARAWKQLRDEAAKQPGAVNLVAERARRERAQAALAEQSYQIRMRDLLPREEVEKVWAAEVVAVRTTLLTWSTSLADALHRVALTEGPSGIERELQEAVRNVLRELSSPDRPLPGASQSPAPAA
jgi:phage terminase Nu1 subunit (DNA packaging protein)